MKVAFIFVENKRWWAFLSPLIMKVQGTDYSHCAIAITDPNFATVFHSEWPVGYCIDGKRFSKTYKIKHHYSFLVSDKQAVNMMHWLANQVRKPYSIAQLVLILIYKYFPFTRPVLSKSIINGDSKDICTEFVSSFLVKFFGVDFKKEDDLIDLNDVHSMVKELNRELKWQSLE